MKAVHEHYGVQEPVMLSYPYQNLLNVIEEFKKKLDGISRMGRFWRGGTRFIELLYSKKVA